MKTVHPKGYFNRKFCTNSNESIWRIVA